MAFVLVSRFLTVVLLLLLSVFSFHCLAKCHVDDETGLLAFKLGVTQDPSGKLSSWKSGTECCTSWSGVSCSGSGSFGKRVTSVLLSSQLDKPGSFLSGTISPSLSKIQYLAQFSVSGNRFTGSIPNSISQLTQLSQLSLDHNLFTGQIPKEILKMKNLAFLILENNQFSGNISNFFGSFSQLQVLRLSYNKLTGELPPTLSALAPKLTVLEISHNVLTGKIPDYLGNFQNLYTLDLSSNQLTGTVPTSFKNLTRIANLNLRRNRLVGQFPELNSLEMDSLDLSYNKFNLGTIPKWVATSSMYSLKLSGCGLKFQLEDFKPTETFLATFIDLSDNQISGSPIGLLNQTTLLKGFWASGNQLQFNMSNLIIPKSLKNLVLAKNQVFGKVPQSISGLKKVDLSHNHLCGQLPVTKFPAEAFLGNDCLCGSPLPPCNKEGFMLSLRCY